MSTTTTDKTVATTILAQLGGATFRMLTGARDFGATNDALTFRLPPGAKQGINLVRVTLTAADDYTLEFFTLRGVKLTPKATVRGVYFDRLQDVFEDETGRFTTLKPRR